MLAGPLFVPLWDKTIMRFAALVLFLMSACSAGEIARYETIVMPLADEDIASGCHYTLTIPASNDRIRAVWVIFDRAHDVHDLYSDPVLEAFARHLRLALLLHSLPLPRETIRRSRRHEYGSGEGAGSSTVHRS